MENENFVEIYMYNEELLCDDEMHLFGMWYN